MRPLPPTPTIADLSPAAQRLARQVPGLYLSRDVGAGPDRALLRLFETLAAPLSELDSAVDQLNADHFIETASLAALPFLAELVSAQIYRPGAPTNRAVIAQMVHHLRRKGVAITLENVLAASTGWSTEVEEAFRSLLMTQWINAPTPHRGRTTVTWDPIALADPLSRSAAWGSGPREAAQRAAQRAFIRLPGENVHQTLARLGRADTQGVAISPRILDLNGWAQAHIALVRTSRVEDAWIEGRDLGDARPAADAQARGSLRRIPHRAMAGIGFVGGLLDPTGLPVRTLWDAPQYPVGSAPQLTLAHEPGPPAAPSRTAVRVLTPTALADRGDVVEDSGALTVSVDGVTLVGASASVSDPRAGFMGAVGPAILRFADARRPSPADRWSLRLVALDNPDSVPATVLGAQPLGAPGAENAATLEFLATKGGSADPVEGPAARVDAGGATPALRITRDALDQGYIRAGDSSWSAQTFAVAGGTALSGVVALDGAAPVQLARLEQRGDAFGIAILQPDGGGDWIFNALDVAPLAPEDRPDLDAPVDGPFHALVAQPGGDLLLVGSDEPEARCGIWQITDPGGAPVIVRVDTVTGGIPAPRLAPGACLHDGRVYMFGGCDEDPTGGLPEPRDDLWSAALAGPTAFVWQPHHMRFPREGREGVARTGGTLLSTPSGPVLIGGASEPGTLSPMVLRADLSSVRPRWQVLPDIPLSGSGSGVLWADASGDDLRALVWDNQTWPRLMTLAAGRGRWQRGAPERADSPNPPADGEAIFDGDRFIVTGPPPLPASEVLLSQGAQAQIAFIPALDLTRASDAAVFTVSPDGDTQRWYAPGDVARLNFRLGGGRLAATSGRKAPDRRIGAVERLDWGPLRLRQCSLAPWDQPLDLELTDGVGFDPRLGRILVRDEIGAGRIVVTHRSGKSAPVGPGFEGRDASIARFWHDPTAAETLTLGAPPDTLPLRYLDPVTAGMRASSGDYLGRIEDAFAWPEQDVRLTAARRLAPATLALAEASRNRLGGLGPQHVGQIDQDADGISLVLRELAEAGGAPLDGPQLWMSSLDVTGRLALELSAGRIDIRWSTIGRPGTLSLSALGAGLQSGPALASLPDARLFVFLTGCHLGRIALPAWVHLVATGCSFDAGDRTATAIAAPGARLRLRHCTILGRTEAGELAASSSAFAGEIATTRPDLGYLRYSVSPPDQRTPCQFESVEAHLSLTSTQLGDPMYLALDANNAPSVLEAGERRSTPGIYADRAGLLREMTARTDDFVPMGLEAQHSDRSRRANFVMNRRLP